MSLKKTKACEDLRQACNVAVVGAGATGLAAALALVEAGIRVALIGPRADPQDTRTTALLASSIAMFERLGVWPRLAAHAAPLRRMRLVDDTGRLVRAPEVVFDAAEIDLSAFASNIPNASLTAELEDALAGIPTLIRHPVPTAEIRLLPDAASIVCADGSVVAARLAVGADGRQSSVRTAEGVDVDAWSYPQSALVLTLAHALSHHDTSTEFHTREGPFTLVPLQGRRSSLVCVATPEETARLASLENDVLARELERRAHAILGAFHIAGPRRVYPLSGLRGRNVIGPRSALVGEAAHVFPPIGAQGLNLGLRDVAALAEAVSRGAVRRQDIGGTAALGAYARARRFDIATRTHAVDLLNRSLLTDFLPIQIVRALGLSLGSRVGPFRRAMMREGLAPQIMTPRLMRGLDLPKI